MWCFFFKQKTAYEVEDGLVGSEMCIRDRLKAVEANRVALGQLVSQGADLREKHLKKALDDLDKFEDTMFAAVRKAAAGVEGPMAGAWNQVLEKMQAGGTLSGAKASTTVEQLAAQMQDAMRTSRAASMRAAIEVTRRFVDVPMVVAMPPISTAKFIGISMRAAEPPVWRASAISTGISASFRSTPGGRPAHVSLTSRAACCESAGVMVGIARSMESATAHSRREMNPLAALPRTVSVPTRCAARGWGSGRPGGGLRAPAGRAGGVPRPPRAGARRWGGGPPRGRARAPPPHPRYPGLEETGAERAVALHHR